MFGSLNDKMKSHFLPIIVVYDVFCVYTSTFLLLKLQKIKMILLHQYLFFLIIVVS